MQRRVSFFENEATSEALSAASIPFTSATAIPDKRLITEEAEAW
jgi:hypothetical protein